MTPLSHTTLYRLYAEDGALLYIGIAWNPGDRLNQGHRPEKPWWSEIHRATFEHFPTRSAALAAERTAIESEHPRYNVVHNRKAHRAVAAAKVIASADPQGWTYRNRRSDNARTTPLWLYPELYGSSCIDGCWSEDGEDQLLFYVDWLQTHEPEQWEADAVRIYWMVEPATETAPFQHVWNPGPGHDDDFLTVFSWPYDEAQGTHLDWFSLPVINDRFPAFAAALQWTPSPLQPTCPLRSIVQSRRGYHPQNRRDRS